MNKGSPTVDSKDIFLNSEERYEVQVVKVAERPHLLCVDDQEEDKHHPPPLTDGCDLAGWRHQLRLSSSEMMEGVLQVGSGCPLLRRERQWPLRSNFPAWTQLQTALLQPIPDDTSPRVDGEEMAQRVSTTTTSDGEVCVTTRFADQWERRNVPVIVLNATAGWKAMPSDKDPFQGWTFENLLARFGHVAWRFSDTHGEMMSLSTYSKYISTLEGLTDDSPLGIYDSEFGDATSPTHVLVDEYTVPPCFSDDLFSHATSSTEVLRPPYRWILMGPPRSGTGLHVDPLWTNAWVTLLQGCKRWMLFPPDTPRDDIGMSGSIQIPSVLWFRDYYDRVTGPDWPTAFRPVQIFQQPGETVFVPHGWPHVVLNLKLSVAVTHNYASEFGDFERMWDEVIAEEPEFAVEWFKGLQEQRPDLVQRIRQHEEYKG